MTIVYVTYLDARYRSHGMLINLGRSSGILPVLSLDRIRGGGAHSGYKFRQVSILLHIHAQPETSVAWYGKFRTLNLGYAVKQSSKVDCLEFEVALCLLHRYWGQRAQTRLWNFVPYTQFCQYVLHRGRGILLNVLRFFPGRCQVRHV